MIQVPQNYTVPANPPSLHNPPYGADVVNPNGTTKDSVTLYISAIKGFDHPLTISYFILKIDARVNSDTTTLPVDDYTTVPADGVALPLEIGTSAANMTFAGAWDNVNFGWPGTILAPGGGPLILTPNKVVLGIYQNPLNTYSPYNYVTLWINPTTTGGSINSAHPPSYQVTIYATDTTVTPNTYASCSFTLVVMPSVQTYGLGVFEVDADGNYTNSISLPKNGGPTDLYFQWYPLEPALPADAELTPITVSFNIFNSTIFDETASMFGKEGGGAPDYDQFNNFPSCGGTNAWPVLTPAPAFTRDNPSTPRIRLHIKLNGTASPTSMFLYERHATIKVTGTDANGVTASAYVVIVVT